MSAPEGTVNSSAPNLSKFSQYPNPPKFSVTGKRKIIDRTDKTPAPNKYDTREMSLVTSKFGRLTRSCSFSQASRFGKKQYESLTKGPGQYETAYSTLSKRDVGFGASTRPPINGKMNKNPGPIYDVLDKNNKNDPTLSQETVKFAGRHGWYYDDPSNKYKLGPGTHTPSFSQISHLHPLAQDCKIGNSLRPGLETHLGVVSTSDGPKYDIKSTLGGNIFYETAPRVSFTQASTRTGKVQKERHTPPFILQPTYFP